MIFYKQLSLIVFLSSFMYAGPMHAGAGRAAAPSDSQSIPAAAAAAGISRSTAGDVPGTESKRTGEGAGSNSATKTKDRKEEADVRPGLSRVSSLLGIAIAQLKELAVKNFDNEAFRDSLKRLPVEMQKQISPSLIRGHREVHGFIFNALKPLLRNIEPELTIPGGDFDCSPDIPGGVFDWSPDGRFLAIGGRFKCIWDVVNQKYVLFWDVVNQMFNLCLEKTFGRYTKQICYSPNGKYLSGVYEGGDICIWDVSTGKIVRTFEDYKGYYCSCSWMSNNKYIAIAAFLHDRINLWDIETGTIVRHNIMPGVYIGWPRLSFSPDYKYIVCDSDVYDVENKRLSRIDARLTGSPDHKMHWHPICSNYLAVTGGTLNVLTRRTLEHTLPKWPYSVSYSFDGRFGASRSVNQGERSPGTAYVWPFPSAASSLELGSKRNIHMICWAPNDYRIALTCGERGELNIFNLTEFARREKELCELTIAEVELLSKMVSNPHSPLTSTDEMAVYWGLPQELRAQYESLQAAKSRKCIVM